MKNFESEGEVNRKKQGKHRKSTEVRKKKRDR